MEIHPLRGVGAWQLSLQTGGAGGGGGRGSARALTRDATLAATLWKRSGALSKTWTQRFAVLKPLTALLYFESEDAAEPKGVMLLDDGGSWDAVPPGAAGREHAFDVRQGGAVYSFAADSPGEAAGWLDALRRCRRDVREADAAAVRRRLAVAQGETAALHATVKSLKARLHEADDALEGLSAVAGETQALHREADAAAVTAVADAGTAVRALAARIRAELVPPAGGDAAAAAAAAAAPAATAGAVAGKPSAPHAQRGAAAELAAALDDARAALGAAVAAAAAAASAASAISRVREKTCATMPASVASAVRCSSGDARSRREMRKAACAQSHTESSVSAAPAPARSTLPSTSSSLASTASSSAGDTGSKRTCVAAYATALTASAARGASAGRKP